MPDSPQPPPPDADDGQGSAPPRDPGDPTTRKSFLLRVPAELLDDLRGWAAQDLRSLNGHIEFLLREALKRRKGGGGSG